MQEAIFAYIRQRAVKGICFIQRTLGKIKNQKLAALGVIKTEFWDINYYKHPPLTEAMVKHAEKELNIKLPAQLIELLMIQNGGYTKGFVYPMVKKTTWADNHVPLDSLWGIVTDKSIESAHNLLDTPYMTEEWGLPNGQVILTGDGHWFITLDYRKGPEPSIRWIDTECDEDIEVAINFDEFIKALVSEDAFRAGE